MPEADGNNSNNNSDNQEDNQDSKYNFMEDANVSQDIKDAFKRLREENKTVRLTNKTLKTDSEKLRQIEADKQKQDDEAKIKNGEAATLVDGLKADNDKLKAENDRLKSIESEVIKDLDIRIKALPKHIQDLAPENMDTAAKQAWVAKAEKSASEAGTGNRNTGGNMNSGTPRGSANEREERKNTIREKMIASGRYYG